MLSNVNLVVTTALHVLKLPLLLIIESICQDQLMFGRESTRKGRLLQSRMTISPFTSNESVPCLSRVNEDNSSEVHKDDLDNCVYLIDPLVDSANISKGGCLEEIYDFKTPACDCIDKEESLQKMTSSEV